MSRYTIRKANLTIVTNRFLSDLVQSWGGCAFILQDKLPTLDYAEWKELGDGATMMLVASFNADEPIELFMDAAARLSTDTTIFVTGNFLKLGSRVLSSIPKNVRLTGFLPEREFQILMNSVDVVVGLTKQDHTLLCCAYEAISLGKPLVLSDTRALREYFTRGVVFAEMNPDGLAKAIAKAVAEKDRLGREVEELTRELEAQWQPKFRELESKLFLLSK